LLDRPNSSVTVVGEVPGVRYFDGRALLGFVDGSANPSDRMAGSILVGEADGEFACLAMS
jgi:putative iron-dependent peroxidase